MGNPMAVIYMRSQLLRNKLHDQLPKKCTKNLTFLKKARANMQYLIQIMPFS
jgi:light-regulated signal transduction histidine kinase (bacteriophytochrome)